jgi:hypothetical protein
MRQQAPFRAGGKAKVGTSPKRRLLQNQMICYPVEYVVNAIENFLVPESNNGKAKFFQNVGAVCIMFDLIKCVMNATIHFDYQSSFMAIEVSNEAIDRMLTFETIPIQPIHF